MHLDKTGSVRGLLSGLVLDFPLSDELVRKAVRDSKPNKHLSWSHDEKYSMGSFCKTYLKIKHIKLIHINHHSCIELRALNFARYGKLNGKFDKIL